MFIPTANDVNHPVPAIVKEHKHYFNPHMLALMFMWDPAKSVTWDIRRPLNTSTHSIDHSMQDMLRVPITELDEDTIDFGCIHRECKPPI